MEKKQLLANDDTLLITQREKQIEQIAEDVVELNTLFQDVSTLVTYQGEIVNNIESNIEKADVDVEKGVGQLNQAARYQKNNRKMICCLVLVLAIICGISVIIILVTDK